MNARFLPILLSTVLVSAPAFADTVVLTSVKDNTLFESASGELSSGVGPAMFVGRTFQGVDDFRRALVAFDVTSIPMGSTITSVVLSMNCDQTNLQSGPQTVTLHAASESWGEGTSNSGGFGTGVTATANDATWIHRFRPGTFWSTAGGTFNAAASGSQTVNAIGAYTWGSTAGMVSDVQVWVENAAVNNGWLIKGNELAPGTAKRFATREAARNKPTLRVDYTPPAVPVESATWGRIKALLSR